MSFNSRIENSRRNMNTMFHATFIVKHVEKIVATLMLNYCNICRSVRFFFIKKSRCLYGSIIELKIRKYRYIIYNITCGGITGQACRYINS